MVADLIARLESFLAILRENSEPIIAIFTVVLAWSTIALWRTTKRSVIVAERAMVDLERPYIYILSPSGLRNAEDADGDHHYVLYSVANYGRTPARIETFQVGVNVGSHPNSPPVQEGWHSFKDSPVLTAGERRDDISAAFSDEIAITEYADEFTPPMPVPDLEEGSALFLTVVIQYSGPFTRGHETSACWRWDHNATGFVLHKDKNYQK